MSEMRSKKEKSIKVFEVSLETEDPEYVDDQWMTYVLNDAFNGPEFHEPEGDHPPRLLSIKTRATLPAAIEQLLPFVAE